MHPKGLAIFFQNLISVEIKIYITKPQFGHFVRGDSSLTSLGGMSAREDNISRPQGVIWHILIALLLTIPLGFSPSIFFPLLFRVSYLQPCNATFLSYGPLLQKGG